MSTVARLLARVPARKDAGATEKPKPAHRTAPATKVASPKPPTARRHKTANIEEQVEQTARRLASYVSAPNAKRFRANTAHRPEAGGKTNPVEQAAQLLGATVSTGRAA